MSNRVAQRYAQALYEAAVDKKHLEDVCSDMKFLKEILSRSSDFNRFCEMPSIKLESRLKILHEIFASKTSKLTENFLMLLAQKNRLNILNLICQQFDIIFAKAHNIQKVDIKSGFELPENVIQSLAEHLKAKLKKEIVSQFSVSRNLIGGIRIQVNDDVYDSTVKSKLDKLTQTILSTG